MKYSNYIGVLASVAIVGVCFIPWVYIPELKLVLSGINGRVNDDLNFGKQVYAQAFFAVIMITLFLTPKIWAKRFNVLVGAIQFAWTIKNYIIFTGCRMGECPEKRAGIFILLILSALIMVIALFPNLKLKPEND